MVERRSEDGPGDLRWREHLPLAVNVDGSNRRKHPFPHCAPAAQLLFLPEHSVRCPTILGSTYAAVANLLVASY